MWYGSNNWQRVALLMGYLYCVQVGLLTLRYDSRSRTVWRPRWLRYYSVCANVVLIGLTPVAMWYDLHEVQSNFSNILIRFTSAFSSAVRYIVVIMVVLNRPWRERQAIRFIDELFELESSYFERHIGGCDSKILGQRYDHFDRLFCVKAWSSSVLMLALCYGYFRVHEINDLSTLLVFFFNINVYNILQGVLMQFFMALMHLSKRMAFLNLQLLQMLEAPDPSAAQMAAIMALHRRLSDKVQCLTVVYRGELMTLQFTNLVNQIGFGYIGIIMCVSLDPVQINAFDVLFLLVCYVASYADAFIVEAICDYATGEYQRTGAILRSFDGQCNGKAFEKATNMFSHMLSLQRLRINVGGFYHIDKTTTFAVGAVILRHTIMMIQYDLQEGFSILKET